MKKIAVIGAGNLGQAFVRGLLNKLPSDTITMSRPRVELLQPFADKGVQTVSNNQVAVADSDYVIVAVKPYKTEEVLYELRDALAKKVVISFVAGIPVSRFSSFLPKGTPLFQVIPNTAMAVNRSMSIMNHNPEAQPHLEEVKALISLVGEVTCLEENQMNAATLLASCGTAYAMRYIRAMTQAGVAIGLKPDLAQKLVSETVVGAGTLLTETDSHPEIEIDKVTTPGGLTIKGLNYMEEQQFSASILQAITKAFSQIKA